MQHYLFFIQITLKFIPPYNSVICIVVYMYMALSYNFKKFIKSEGGSGQKIYKLTSISSFPDKAAKKKLKKDEIELVKPM